MTLSSVLAGRLLNGWALGWALFCKICHIPCHVVASHSMDVLLFFNFDSSEQEFEVIFKILDSSSGAIVSKAFEYLVKTPAPSTTVNNKCWRRQNCRHVILSFLWRPHYKSIIFTFHSSIVDNALACITLFIHFHFCPLSNTTFGRNAHWGKNLYFVH